MGPGITSATWLLSASVIAGVWPSLNYLTLVSGVLTSDMDSEVAGLREIRSELSLRLSLGSFDDAPIAKSHEGATDRVRQPRPRENDLSAGSGLGRDPRRYVEHTTLGARTYR